MFLVPDELLMLSLITWHFDASLQNLSTTQLPPKDLLQHLSTSTTDEVCKNMVASYSQYSGQKISLKALMIKFRMLIRLVLINFLSHFSEPLCTEEMISFLLYYIYGEQCIW